MRKLIILIAFVYPYCVNAQVMQEWVSHYSDTANILVIPTAMVVNEDGNAIVTGYTYRAGTGYDFITLKYSQNGQILWKQIFDGGENGKDQASAIAIDDSGNVYVTGISNGNINNSDLAIIKYNSDGTVKWTKFYGENNGREEFTTKKSLIVDSKRNLFVSLRGATSTQIGVGIVTLKYSPEGILLWERIYGSHEFDIPIAMSLDNDENIIISGQGHSSTTNYDYATIKYNTSGDSIWSAVYTSSGYLPELCRDMYVDKFNNVYVTGGGTLNPSTYQYDILTVKYDSAGNELWTSRFDGTGNSSDFGRAIVVDDSQNVYIVGTTYSDAGFYNLITMALDENGTLKWERQFGETFAFSQFGSFSIKDDKSGYIYVSGAIESDSNYMDFATLKYDNSGNLKWSIMYDYNGSSDYPSDLFVDNDGFVYVTGSSLSSSTIYPLSTIKYSQTVGINPVSSETPEKFNLYQNYPNPFNPSTKIRFSIPKSGLVKLTVHDIIGRQVSELVNRSVSAGTFEYEFDGSRLTSGVYFYRLEAGDFVQTKRMVLVK